ncbi:diguanylate cyclase [Leeia sp.]|uniref:GGDEF domain-containing protein n=1 Tax=Leeia sp. TaxID=2884678 RepID=UPI0035B32530
MDASLRYETLFAYSSQAHDLNELGLQLTHFGYVLLHFGSTEELATAMKVQMPSAVLLEGRGEEVARLADEVTRLRASLPERIPILGICDPLPFEDQVQIVRAGCAELLIHPYDLTQLVDRLDRQTDNLPFEPYRVLIVDDSHSIAEHTGKVLRQAGMVTRVETDPLILLQAIEEFEPELLLVDMYMPECTGDEAAKVIRQQDNMASLPIVFLSGETDISKQLLARRKGGDDFLTKPIQPQVLVESVTITAERYRTLRRLMCHDGLTGLLTHSHFGEQLLREVARNQREPQALALAMLDIDHFKRINDSYGHPVGDRVIRSLSRMLQMRLRRFGQLGRYGGEEFAVLLPETSLEVAMQRIDALRQAYMQLQHTAGEVVFNSTFSAGVAAWKPGMTASELSLAADQALYRAKQGGRNQVCGEG